MNALTIPLPVLITSLRAARQVEEEAAKQRLAIEAQIIAQYPQKTEGSITDKDHGITVTYGVTRKVDSSKLTAAWNTLDENMRKAFAWEAKVVTKTMRALQDLQPETYAHIASFITTTPRKPAIILKD